MKINYFCKALVPSRMAASIHIMKMCEALADNGHDVVLFVLREKSIDTSQVTNDVYQYYNVRQCFKVVWLPTLAIKSSRIRYVASTLLATGSIARKIITSKPDLVFGRDLFSCSIAALIGKKVVFESHFPVWHSMLESVMFKLLLRLPKFKKLIVISESLRQVYLNHYSDLEHSKVIVAHDAANMVSDWKRTDKLQGDQDGLNVGYVGHLYKGKGLEVIAKVAPELPDVNFHIIGGLDRDIAYWQSKINYSNVFFYGFIKQDCLSPYIHKLDICLLPNQHHIYAFGANNKVRKLKNISDFTSPLKMFEYMAHKKPVIASDLPVLREVLSDSIALLVHPEDVTGWVEAVKKLGNVELREKLANAAYCQFLEKYTWEKRANIILADL